MSVNFNINSIPTPYYIIDESLLIKNLELLKTVQEKSGCKILLAQKAFSMFSIYPLISQYLCGTTASGLYEAKLGYECFGKETHVFSPAYTEQEIKEISEIADYVILNSKNQLDKYKSLLLEKNINIGLRINPEFSTQEHGIYDPCAVGSRLGITQKNFSEIDLNGVTGLHFHTLCEQNADDLVKTLNVVEQRFSAALKAVKWVNFGGGHHITREDYDVELLVEAIKSFKQKYNVEVYLEPGEAVVLNTGFLAATVLDIVENNINIAILDSSAACHMPDVLEMPYRPQIIDADLPNAKPYTYRLAGATCLAGDIIGDYSFDNKLKTGDKLIFCDMAHYSMVKNNTFNGMALPSIAIAHKNGDVEIVKEFNFTDFKNRLS